ncbi:DUF3054 domain-containing protein [Luteococcus peritonei]|uniref:DUF3054 domain-containing protein n=1 Tax=Luteococcus peritonei TaxID=88874 RepID=A0ABW4RU52_9ACTN
MTKQVALAIDLVLVVVFAALGRASHQENIFAGLVHTAWPFLVACMVGWAILLLRRRPALTVASGVFLWLVTAWGGLALRMATGTSARVPFWIVTTVVLGLFLVGWRLLARRRVAQA